MYCYVKNPHTSMDKVMIYIYEENNNKYFMCIVMLRILNLSYINGKTNDLYLRRNQQEIRSTIISFFIDCYHYGGRNQEIEKLEVQ